MPSTVADPPSVSLSFANNFWGKDDAGVTPLLERMHHSKVTSDELKGFYAARTAIEEDYAKKLLTLARKPLGSCEAGTLRMSLDVVRGEVEVMGKAHQNIAQQMRTELDEQLAAFAGGMKERRKIVQTGIEKLHKLKTQQGTTVAKARDRYEQDCLKIKGYLAQGHMVMGQEERKNKAKLEKTQIQLSTSQNEYEAAVKILEETTVRWNRDWKAACDKFQDLEEERIDFMKSSLWSFANIASTVCVNDDAACEKIRLSLEDCDVEKDIYSFIKSGGTGQEIPDPPRFINFCRGDINDAASDVSADDAAYSVAQFQRTMNPAFRSSSPQPSTFDSHNDPQSVLAQDMAREMQPDAETTPRRPTQQSMHASVNSRNGDDYADISQHDYAQDSLSRGPPLLAMTGSDLSSVQSPGERPTSRDSHSEYSNPTSFSSQEPSLASISPTKQYPPSMSGAGEPEKKKSGFFQNRSPFKRKSKADLKQPETSNRDSWALSSPSRDDSSRQYPGQQRSVSPEPADPRASFQLNVGNNVFDVASPDKRRTLQRPVGAQDDLDPIARALADLKGVGKQSTPRVSADNYAGLKNPGQDGTTPSSASSTMRGRPRSGTQAAPPPSYEQSPVSHLGAPQPAFTSRQMQQTTQKYTEQKQNMFSTPSRYGQHQERGPQPASQQQQQPMQQRTSPQSRPGTRSGPMAASDRATSPSPYRSTSPRPGMGNLPRAASPNPYLANGGHSRTHSFAQDQQQHRPRANSTSPMKQGPQQMDMRRSLSPQPQFSRSAGDEHGGSMAMQLAPVHNGRPAPQQNGYGSVPRGRPISSYGAGHQGGAAPGVGPDTRARSRSTASGRQFTREGRPILHFARAMYMYQAAIPEELSFVKGDVMAVLRHQDDGWWEAEVVGKRTRPGLVPSNYLVNC